MSQPPLSDDLRRLEGRLKGLTPAAALDRDRLLFEAGRASARRGWVWPLTAAAAGLAAVVLGALLLVQVGRPAAERVVYVPIPVERPAPVAVPEAPPAEIVPGSPEAAPLRRYRQVEEQILRWDLDGLPRAAPPPGPTPASRDELLRSL
jgi:hypothetical protein